MNNRKLQQFGALILLELTPCEKDKMATRPTPEEHGRKILSIFDRFKRKPNEIVTQRSLLSQIDGAVLSDGLDWLIRKGFITTKNRNVSLILTAAGFAEIYRTKSPTSEQAQPKP